MTADVTDLCNRVTVNLPLQRKIPQLDISRCLLAWRPEGERYIRVDGQRGGDCRRIGTRDRERTRPTGAGSKRSWGQEIGTRLSIAGPPVTNGSRVHDAVASADNQSAACVPRKANARAKFLQRGVECGVRRIHTELFPFDRKGVKESIAVVDFMERLIVLPPQPQVQRQPRRELEVVLREKRVGPRARGNERVLHLHTAVVHHAKQEIRKAISRL